MDQLTETRWRRYGQDRVYVQAADGTDLGYIDLQTETVVVSTPCHAQALNDCASRWLEPPTPSPVPVAARVRSAAEDVSANAAGAAARATRDAVRSTVPVFNLIARMLGVKTDERAWRLGATGETEVGNELTKLFGDRDDWHVLHAVAVGERGSDIDHVVIGPPGVITLDTKCHPGGRAYVVDRAVRINGHRTDYLRNSRFEAARATRLLSKACGFDVPVKAAIVFVGLDAIDVKQMPTDVHVTTRRRLGSWFASLPITTATQTVETIFARARLSTNWR